MTWIYVAAAVAFTIWLTRFISDLLAPAPCGIVLLSSKFRPLDLDVMACVIKRELGADMTVVRSASDVRGENWISGDPFCLIARIQGRDYCLHSLNVRYFEPQPWAKMPAQTSGMIQKHKAWLSMEVLSGIDPEAYRAIARIAARLVDADTVALYHPPLRRLVASTGNVVPMLRSGDPIEAVFVASLGRGDDMGVFTETASHATAVRGAHARIRDANGYSGWSAV